VGGGRRGANVDVFNVKRRSEWQGGGRGGEGAWQWNTQDAAEKEGVRGEGSRELRRRGVKTEMGGVRRKNGGERCSEGTSMEDPVWNHGGGKWSGNSA